jgi:hypothetical protein
MPKIVITHAVKDVETWLAGKAERVAMFSPFATNVTDHVAMDGSNNVAITADVQDMAAAQAIRQQLQVYDQGGVAAKTSYATEQGGNPC